MTKRESVGVRMDIPGKTVYDVPVSVVRADGSTEQGKRSLIAEHRVRIYVNQSLLYDVVCSCTDLKEMAAGRLLVDGKIRTAEDILSCKRSEDASIMEITLKENIRQGDEGGREEKNEGGREQENEGGREQENEGTREQENEGTREQENEGGREEKNEGGREEASGVTGADETEPAGSAGGDGTVPSSECIFHLIREFSKGSPIHSVTKAAHSAILMCGNEIQFVTEDISRHNALDKAIGYMVLRHLPPAACILYTSGRVPLDALTKVAFTGIPVLVSKAVPTTAAVRAAADLHMTLIGRAWSDSYEIYSQ